MDRTFQHNYAKIVTDFTLKMPPDLTVTPLEIDSYFRDCVLYLLSYNEQMKSKPDPGIFNQLYTEVPVSLSPEQLASKIDLSQPGRNAGIAAPDFFPRMLKADAASGTHNCREFIRIQQEVLMLYASSEVTFSFEESRRIAFLNDRLTAVCEQEEAVGTAIPESEEANVSQDAITKLNSLLKGSADSTFRKGRGGTPKYTRQRKIEREPVTEEVPELVKRVERTVAPRLSTKEPGSKKSDSALYSGDGTHGKRQTDDTVQVRLADYVEKALKNKKDKIQSGEKRKSEGARPTLEESLAKLDRMIGLDSVKSQVHSLIDYVKISKLREKHGSKSQPMSYHLIFTGNPGTGKTTVAQIVADIYAALGILRKGQLVAVDRKDLVGEYVGKTEKKTRKIIKKALGGVLFIDEAYLLSSQDDKKDYGQIAVGTILKAMEDHRDDLVVIVAGYDNLMKDFIASNPGLKSRFATKIKFEDYNGEQLYKIFLSMVQAGGYQLNVQANVLAMVYFQHMYRNRKEEFGNGREVRNSYEKLRVLQAKRLSQLGTELTKEELDTFTSDDVLALTNTVDEVEDQQEGDKKEQEDDETVD